MFHTKVVQKIKTHIFMIKWKNNGTDRAATDDKYNTAHAHWMLDK
jgi:hypothetical protein